MGVYCLRLYYSLGSGPIDEMSNGNSVEKPASKAQPYSTKIQINLTHVDITQSTQGLSMQNPKIYGGYPTRKLHQQHRHTSI